MLCFQPLSQGFRQGLIIHTVDVLPQDGSDLFFDGQVHGLGFFQGIALGGDPDDDFSLPGIEGNGRIGLGHDDGIQFFCHHGFCQPPQMEYPGMDDPLGRVAFPQIRHHLLAEHMGGFRRWTRQHDDQFVIRRPDPDSRCRTHFIVEHHGPFRDHGLFLVVLGHGHLPSCKIPGQLIQPKGTW